MSRHVGRSMFSAPPLPASDSDEDNFPMGLAFPARTTFTSSMLTPRRILQDNLKPPPARTQRPNPAPNPNLLQRPNPPTTIVALEKKKRPTLIGPQPMVTVSVYMDLKEEAESFQVHKNFITHYSPFFSAAFNGNFAEGESQKLELDDTEPAVFGSFVQWLYTQDIVDGEGSLPDQPTLVNLWILADKILVPRLQNQIIRALDLSRRASEEARPHPGMCTGGRMSMTSITSTERPTPPRRIKQDPTIFHRLYECTAKGSPLRSYFVDICSRGSHEEISDEVADDYPHEMLVDIINKMRRRERHVCRAASSCSEYYVSEDIAEKRDARVK